MSVRLAMEAVSKFVSTRTVTTDVRAIRGTLWQVTALAVQVSWPTKLVYKLRSLHTCIVIFMNVDLTDLNECLTENGGCRQTCTNTVGSYVCSCNEGFTLASDRRNCTGKPWPRNFTIIIIIIAGAKTERELIIIALILLYNFSDINECQSNMGGCAHSCYNTIGSFTCDCMPGYTLANDDSTCNGEIQ